jgi:hypothetical protein
MNLNIIKQQPYACVLLSCRIAENGVSSVLCTDVPHLPNSYLGNGDNKDINIYHHVNNDDGSVREDIHSVFDTDNTHGEKQHQSLNGVKVVDIGDTSSGDLSPTLVIAVGCAGTLVALLFIGSLIVVCGIRRRRRRHNISYKDGGGGLGVPVETYALVQTSSVRRHRQPGDPLPPPDVGDPVDDIIVVAASPCANRADSVQRRAWETMLNAAQSEVDDVPEFDCCSDDETRDVTASPISGRAVLKYTPSRAGTTRGRTTGYGATDDGLYHSGDAVDDVIERIDSSNRASQLYTAPRTISRR